MAPGHPTLTLSDLCEACPPESFTHPTPSTPWPSHSTAGPTRAGRRLFVIPPMHVPLPGAGAVKAPMQTASRSGGPRVRHGKRGMSWMATLGAHWQRNTLSAMRLLVGGWEWRDRPRHTQHRL